MKKIYNSLSIASVLMMIATGTSVAAATDAPIYKDAKQPVDTRVQDLMSRMTLDEKIAQLQTIWEKKQLLETDQFTFNPEHAKELLGSGIGEVARPSENKDSFSPNKTPLQTAKFTNAIQKWVKENTRLGIPVIFHDEALHGHVGRNSTSFPQAIGLASTWDPDLLKNIYDSAARETRVRGTQEVLAPILDVARDPRWGRIEETMGEDPYLIATLGVAAIEGFQGSDNGVIKDHVMTTLKHMAGHGEPTGGLNTAPAPVGEHTFRETFLFPFEAAVKTAHPRSVMPSYNEVDGVPSHANKKMLQGILRDEWGFDGLLVSDYFAIPELQRRHHLAEDLAGAANLSITAGVDIETPDIAAYGHLKELVQSGKLSEAVINASVARVLREKFIMGLFENPYVKEQGVDEFVGNAKHRALAQKAAEETMVLLKNDKNILPLDVKKIKSIAVIGPHVNETLIGGYSDVPKQTVSILQGVRDYVAKNGGKNIEVNYAKGTLLTIEKWKSAADTISANSWSKERWNTNAVVFATEADTKGMIEEAVAAAKKSDVALVVVGDNEATSREGWDEAHVGDRVDLTLLGQQQTLVDAVLATGKPTIVLLINGRPLSVTKISQTVPAIIEGWYLGQETGTAVARVLFGDVNPGGKLPVSIARSVGQLPIYYNYKPTAKRGYLDSDTSPLYPFGFGLSYTQFNYSDFKIDKADAKVGDLVTVSVKLTNSGDKAGDEVVQLYVHDLVASRTRPVKELRGFKRVSLKAKESAVVSFELAVNQLGLYDDNMKYVVEPGKFDLMIGSSSQDIRSQGQLNVTGEVTDVSKQKVYFSRASIAK